MRGEITRFNPLSPTLSLWEREEKACALFDGLINNSIGGSVAPPTHLRTRGLRVFSACLTDHPRCPGVHCRSKASQTDPPDIITNLFRPQINIHKGLDDFHIGQGMQAGL
ncbi:MAG: hypothetical protein H6R47_739 [Proteobacteria bacterium]|nr:hypothetical protein [Pseudomonadota bacterium]